jgi:Flp pilus assembly protein TadD
MVHRRHGSCGPDAALDAALACVHRAIELDPELAEAHAVAGFIRFWNGDHEASTRAFERAESLAPENARNLERHAFCLAMSGQTAYATEYVRRAQVCNPREPHYFPRAMFAFVSGDFAQAVSLLRASVDRLPAFLPSSIFLAAALELVGDSTGAAEAVAGLRKANAGESFPNTLRHWLPAMSHPGMRPLHEGFARAWSLWESGSR